MSELTPDEPTVPSVQRVRVEGTLDTVQASGSSFRLILDDGQGWVRSPTDPPLSREVGKETARRLQSVMVDWSWPGNETDQEVQTALKELG